VLKVIVLHAFNFLRLELVLFMIKKCGKLFLLNVYTGLTIISFIAEEKYVKMVKNSFTFL